TAVLFGDEAEVGRVTGFDTYTVTVENTGREESTGTDFDLVLRDSESGSEDKRPDGTATLSSADGAAPGSEFSNEGVVKNSGDSTGKVYLQNVSVVSRENGLTEPEQAVDSSGGDPGVGAGELAQFLKVRIAVTNDSGDRTYVFGSASEFRPITELES
ncbi:MAG: hypothetical protein ABEI99_05655, partial [Halobaculum sp.]